MKCPKCHRAINDASRFCPFCGAQVLTNAPMQPGEQRDDAPHAAVPHPAPAGVNRSSTAPTPNPAPMPEPKTSTPSTSAPAPHAPSTAQVPAAPSRPTKPAKRFHAAQWGAIGAIVVLIALLIFMNVQIAKPDDQFEPSSSSTEQEASSSDSGGDEGSSADSSGSGDDTSDGSDATDGTDSTDSSGSAATFEPTVNKSIEAELDNSGVKERVTFKSTGWILGSDKEKLDAIWKSVGGEGAFPIDDDALNTKLANSVVLIGTVEFDNLTPGFESSHILFNGGLDIDFKKGAEAAEGSTMGIGYGGTFSHAAGAYQTSNSGVTVTDARRASQAGEFPNPDMTDRTHWGPVPFAYVLGNYKTPRYPNGDPTLDSVEVSLTAYGYNHVEPVVLPVTKSF